MGASARRVLLVSSSGGVLLDLLALEHWWSRHDPQWVSVAASDTETALHGAKVHWRPEQAVRHPLRLAHAVVAAWRLLRRERPDVLVSAGSAVAVPFFVAARFARVPTIWVETFNIVDGSGVSARLCSKLAARVLVQRQELVASRPRAVFVGELY